MTTPRLPTASQLERVRQCPGSCFLPVVEESDQHASRGVVLHAFLADCLNHGRDTALARVPDEHRAACEALDTSALPTLDPERYAAEVAFAWDPTMDIGRELGRGLSRAEAYRNLHAGELGGTADLVGLADGQALVLDYKSGAQRDLAPAARNPQMRALALYACRTYQVASARVALIRLHDDGSPWFDWAEFDSLDLDEAAAELNEVLARIEGMVGRSPDFHRGPWCARCPSFDFCPAQATLLRAAVATPEQVATGCIAALDQGARAEAYRRWRELELLARRLGERVGAYAAHQAIELGGGKFYGYAPGPERVADANLVRDALLNTAGADAAEKAVKPVTELHATKAQIQAALRGVPKQQREEAWRLLRASGALKTSATLREHVREEEAATAAAAEATEAA